MINKIEKKLEKQIIKEISEMFVYRIYNVLNLNKSIEKTINEDDDLFWSEVISSKFFKHLSPFKLIEVFYEEIWKRDGISNREYPEIITEKKSESQSEKKLRLEKLKNLITPILIHNPELSNPTLKRFIEELFLIAAKNGSPDFLKEINVNIIKSDNKTIEIDSIFASKKMTAIRKTIKNKIDFKFYKKNNVNPMDRLFIKGKDIEDKTLSLIINDLFKNGFKVNSDLAFVFFLKNSGKINMQESVKTLCNTNFKPNPKQIIEYYQNADDYFHFTDSVYRNNKERLAEELVKMDSNILYDFDFFTKMLATNNENANKFANRISVFMDKKEFFIELNNASKKIIFDKKITKGIDLCQNKYSLYIPFVKGNSVNEINTADYFIKELLTMNLSLDTIVFRAKGNDKTSYDSINLLDFIQEHEKYFPESFKLTLNIKSETEFNL